MPIEISERQQIVRASRFQLLQLGGDELAHEAVAFRLLVRIDLAIFRRRRVPRTELRESFPELKTLT